MKVTQSGLLFFMLIVAPHSFAMNTAEMENKYFIYEQDTDKGIWLKKEDVINNSHVIKNMIADLSSTSHNIPLAFPIDTIKLAFYILNGKIKNFTILSLEQCINIANLFNFLDVPSEKMNLVLTQIKKNIDTNDVFNNFDSFGVLKKLDPDVLKLLLTQPTINHIQHAIIKKNANKRKKILVGHTTDVHSVTFSPNTPEIISVSADADQADNYILWDISNLDKITFHKFSRPINILAVAWSPDGTKVAISFDILQDSLSIWDMSNPNKIIDYSLIGHPDAVTSIAFSPDSNSIVSVCKGNKDNLIVSDISDLNAITYHVLHGGPDTVYSAQFSADGKKIVSGSKDNKKSLMVWNISNMHSISSQPITARASTIYAAAFHPQHEHLIITSASNENNENSFMVWNISNLHHPTHQIITQCPQPMHCATYDPHGTLIASGCNENLMLWDSTNPTMPQHILTGHSSTVTTIAFNHKGTQMLSGSLGPKNNLILWTLLTDQEEQTINRINTCNADQIQFMYWLCLQSLNNRIIMLKQNSEEYRIFTSLPQDIQNLLHDVLLSQSSGWLSGLWQILKGRD